MTAFATRLAHTALALATLALTPAQSAEPPLRIMYDVRAPLVTFDGKRLQGNIGKPAQTALERSGIHFEISEIPIRRQLMMIQQNITPACAVARLKNVERARVGVFSALIAESPPYVAVVRRNDVMPEPYSLQSWASHRELRWGVLAGLYYSDYVQDKILGARATVASFHTDHQHFANLLIAQRVDFVIVQEDEAQELLNNGSSAPKNALRSIALTDMRRGEQRFFYCNKIVPEATMSALNKALLLPH